MRHNNLSSPAQVTENKGCTEERWRLEVCSSVVSPQKSFLERELHPRTWKHFPTPVQTIFSHSAKPVLQISLLLLLQRTEQQIHFELTHQSNHCLHATQQSVVD